jgi:serralysin
VIKGFEPGQFADSIDLSAIDANTNQAGNQAFTFVASTDNPASGEVSYFRSGDDTIVVANTGGATFQILLQDFDGPLMATDFSL